MMPLHVGKSRVVIGHPFGQDVIQVPLTEQKSSLCTDSPFQLQPKVDPLYFRLITLSTSPRNR